LGWLGIYGKDLAAGEPSSVW